MNFILRFALLASAVLTLCLSSCVVDAYGPGVATVGVGLGYYETLPAYYDDPYYYYDNRYYYGGVWEPGHWSYGGRFYDGRYHYGTRVFYGGRYDTGHHHHHRR